MRRRSKSGHERPVGDRDNDARYVRRKKGDARRRRAIDIGMFERPGLSTNKVWRDAEPRWQVDSNSMDRVAEG